MKVGKIRLTLTLVALMAGATMAANRVWSNNGAPDNLWTNTVHWTLPGSADNARFNANGDYAILNVDAGTINGLQMGFNTPGGITTTLDIVSGGALNATLARLGYLAGDTGIVNINGGSFTYNAGNAAIGYGGGGIVNVNSGSLMASTALDLGRSSGSEGRVNLYGGMVSVATDLVLGNGNAVFDTSGFLTVTNGTATADRLLIGAEGAGTALLSGGTVTVADITRVGGFQGGNGTLTVDADGLLTTKTLNVGNYGGTGVATLNGGTVNVTEDIQLGLNGILTVGSAATLTYTLMNIKADGLLVWEGDHTTDVATYAGDGTFTGSGGLVDIATLVEGVDYDQALSTTEGFLLSKFDGTDTAVWTVIPEPATLGLVAAMGAGLLFVRRMFRI